MGVISVTTVALAACGDDPSTPAAPQGPATSTIVRTTPISGGEGEFCARLAQADDVDVPRRLPLLAQTGLIYRRTSARMRAVDPPAELADAWHALEETMSEVGAVIGDFDVSDQDEKRLLEQKLDGMQGQLDALAAAGETLRAYEQKHCRVPPPPSPDTTTP